MDGSKALHKAITETFGDRALIQRCTLHKCRNIKQHIPPSAQKEFSRKWRCICLADHLGEARIAYQELEHWLHDQRLFKARNSLREGKEELLTVFKLGLSKACHKSFQSTNIHESATSALREQLTWVKRWNNKEHVLRWAATFSIRLEQKSFRRVRFCAMEELVDKLAMADVARKNLKRIQEEVTSMA